MTLAAVFVAALAILGGSAYLAQRGYRTCIACGCLFPCVADRRHHEQIAHSL